MLLYGEDRSIVVKKVRTAYDFIHRLKGLMLDRDLPEDEALHIRPCRSVHTCFMRFPIDVVYVDDNLRIIAIEEHMGPFRFGRSRSDATSVFEFQAGIVQKKELAVGQTLQFQK
ncbi:DUF192 domain-containing protein [Bacillaceae bacterium S4-13-56]